MTCRICRSPARTILDLGRMPLANRLRERLDQDEPKFPLALEFCAECGNIQLGYCVETSLLYDEYIYVTPNSPSLERHYANFVYHMRGRGYLPRDGFLFEFGSNVGHFLRHVRPSVGRILGLDPARVIANLAASQGVPTLCAYFGPETARTVAADHGRADVVVARHCAAHNADAHALVAGAALMLKPTGVFAMENAYGLNTVLNQEIGQIYHEHMFYFTASAVRRLFAAHGLDLVDLLFAADIHGGAMTFFGAPAGTRPIQPVVEATLAREDALLTDALFSLLPAALARWRGEVRELFDGFRRNGRSVWLYGASAKAATFVNAIGLTAEDAPFCADSSPAKVGRYMPGTGIKIVSEEEAIAAAPDYYLLTAWNYRDELMRKVRDAGNLRSGFAVPFPDVMVIDPAAADAR